LLPQVGTSLALPLCVFCSDRFFFGLADDGFSSAAPLLLVLWPLQYWLHSQLLLPALLSLLPLLLLLLWVCSKRRFAPHHAWLQ
jgi:hypothetical protein